MVNCPLFRECRMSTKSLAWVSARRCKRKLPNGWDIKKKKHVPAATPQMQTGHFVLGTGTCANLPATRPSSRDWAILGSWIQFSIQGGGETFRGIMLKSHHYRIIRAITFFNHYIAYIPLLYLIKQNWRKDPCCYWQRRQCKQIVKKLSLEALAV